MLSSYQREAMAAIAGFFRGPVRQHSAHACGVVFYEPELSLQIEVCYVTSRAVWVAVVNTTRGEIIGKGIYWKGTSTAKEALGRAWQDFCVDLCKQIARRQEMVDNVNKLVKYDE